MGKGRDRSASSRLTNCMPSTPGLSWNVMQTLRRASTVGIYTYNQGGCAFGSLSRTPITRLVRSFQSTNSKNKHENTAPQRSQSFQLLSHQIHKQLDSRPVHHITNHALPNCHRRSRNSRLCSCPAHDGQQPKRQPLLPRPPRRSRQIHLLRRQRPRRNLLLLNLQAPRRPLRHSLQRPSLGQRGQLRRLRQSLPRRQIDCCDGKKRKQSNPTVSQSKKEKEKKRGNNKREREREKSIHY